MKILHLTDIHYDVKILDWVLSQEQAYDALCMTGDFLDTAIHTPTPIEAQISTLKSWLAKLTKPTFICSGNHDPIETESNQSIEQLFSLEDDDGFIPSQNEERIQWIQELSSGTTFVDGTRKEFFGFKFGCIPYEEEDLSAYSDCDIILHHLPPSRTKVAIGEHGDFGCDYFASALKHRLVNPKVVLSGHIHQPKEVIIEQNGIWLLNPGFGWKNGVPRHHLIELSKTRKKLEFPQLSPL